MNDLTKWIEDNSIEIVQEYQVYSTKWKVFSVVGLKVGEAVENKRRLLGESSVLREAIKQAGFKE